MAATTTFLEMQRNPAFDGFVQEVLLESRKQYNDLELYLHNLMEYLSTHKWRIYFVLGDEVFYFAGVGK